MNIPENKVLKFTIIFIIISQLLYIVIKRYPFNINILKSSFVKNFGAQYTYVLPERIIELKNIGNSLKIDKFNLSNNLKNKNFFYEWSIEFMYPIKFDEDLDTIFYEKNETIPKNCSILKEFKSYIYAECKNI